jgi:hypothetical protein
VRALKTESQKFKRKAIRVDTRRILEAAMGYECHPETGQGIIARKRLEERLLKREIHIQVRRATCTERTRRTRRKTRKQIHSVSGTHDMATPETGAANFCGEDRVFHRLSRQLTRFAAGGLRVRASSAAATIPAMAVPACFPVARSGSAWWHY